MNEIEVDNLSHLNKNLATDNIDNINNDIELETIQNDNNRNYNNTDIELETEPNNNNNNSNNNNNNINNNNDNNNDKNEITNKIENGENEKINIFLSIKLYFIQYFKKWKGGEKSPARADLEEIGWSWLTSFIGILVLALLHYRLTVEKETIFLLGSFAASAVLIFGAPKSPLAQPRNLVLGHIVSATVGSIVRVALVYTNAQTEVACALAVSLAIVGMHFTKSIHPPGGATALICVMSAEQRWRGFYYIFVPVASGSLTMLLTALIVNNFARKRKYPVFWW
ncbi:hypothetical protein ACTFIV_007026 [Dictyostelium citrinum]